MCIRDRFIKDDDLFAILVQSLAPGVSLVAVMDCCHSGTLLDLGYDFTLNDAQFEHERERIAKKVPLNGSVAGETAHALVHFVPNTAKTLGRVVVKTLDVACEATSEVLQRIATSIPLRGLRYVIRIAFPIPRF